MDFNKEITLDTEIYSWTFKSAVFQKTFKDETNQQLGSLKKQTDLLYHSFLIQSFESYTFCTEDRLGDG